jgi:hypothetical protein
MVMLGEATGVKLPSLQTKGIKVVRWKIYVNGKQRGEDYTSESRAINNAGVIARSNKQVYVYMVIDGNGSKQVAKWIEGTRIG